MHSSLNLDVLRLLTADRESELRPAAMFGRHRPMSPVLRSLGRQLMHVGTWLAADAPLHPAEAR